MINPDVKSGLMPPPHGRTWQSNDAFESRDCVPHILATLFEVGSADATATPPIGEGFVPHACYHVPC